VNNTLYDNGTQAGNDNEGTPSGEFQIQFQVGSAQGNIYENNLLYAGSPNIWINSFVPCSASYPCPPATLNWNLYHSHAGYQEGTSISWAGVKSYESFAKWRSISGEDANSLNTNPLFVNREGTPPNFSTVPSSPAVAAGSTSLACSVGWCDPNGASPDSIYGSTDFLGNPRRHGSKIDIGAFENTGVEIPNSLTVDLTSKSYTLQPGQAITLRVIVSAAPGGGGVPGGTVEIKRGSRLLRRQTLIPVNARESVASLPLRASQLEPGANKLTAVYSGNAIAPCCPVSGPPVTVYGSSTAPPITVTLR
jgi:Bacterial Ig-like domain (group 3)